MKLSLVVASGVHQGKSIAISSAQFLIGRDEGCQLRPASPAISKKHCGISIKDGLVYVEDFGSTNGTFLNDNPVQQVTTLTNGDRLKVGPLDFTVSIIQTSPSDTTPLPEVLKAVPAAKTESISTQTPAAGLKPVEPVTQKVSVKSGAADGDDPDQIAAMLLGMSDEENGGEVPGGSTVMELPAVDAAKLAAAGAATKKDDKKVPTQAQSSSAAADLLRKYMRRPK